VIGYSWGHLEHLRVTELTATLILTAVPQAGQCLASRPGTSATVQSGSGQYGVDTPGPKAGPRTENLPSLLHLGQRLACIRPNSSTARADSPAGSPRWSMMMEQSRGASHTS